MIAEIFPVRYDAEGHHLLLPGRKERRVGFRPTFPMGRNFTQPLRHRFKDLESIRKFLCSCRGVDFGHDKGKDYWQPPEEFEQTRAGDCVDFALWTWRQLVDLGYKARFNGGKAGRFGEQHAWVTFEVDGKTFLVEPQFAPLGPRMPRLSTLRYQPSISVTWDGAKASYFEHEARSGEPPLLEIPPLVWEWVSIWAPFGLRFIRFACTGLARRLFQHFCRSPKTRTPGGRE